MSGRLGPGLKPLLTGGPFLVPRDKRRDDDLSWGRYWQRTRHTVRAGAHEAEGSVFVEPGREEVSCGGGDGTAVSHQLQEIMERMRWKRSRGNTHK